VYFGRYVNSVSEKIADYIFGVKYCLYIRGYEGSYATFKLTDIKTAVSVLTETVFKFCARLPHPLVGSTY